MRGGGSIKETFNRLLQGHPFPRATRPLPPGPAPQSAFHPFTSRAWRSLARRLFQIPRRVAIRRLTRRALEDARGDRHLALVLVERWSQVHLGQRLGRDAVSWASQELFGAGEEDAVRSTQGAASSAPLTSSSRDAPGAGGPEPAAGIGGPDEGQPARPLTEEASLEQGGPLPPSNQQWRDSRPAPTIQGVVV